MRLDKLPVGEAIVGFLLVALIATFIVAKQEVGNPTSGEANGGSASPTASAGGSETPGPGGNSLVMTDNKFDKTSLDATAGQATTFDLKNNGAAIHNVDVSDASGKFAASFCTASGSTPCSNPARLAGGATGTLTFTLSAGTYQFRCDYHPTEMKGTLTVK